MKRPAPLVAGALAGALAIAAGADWHVTSTRIDGALRAANAARSFCELTSLELEAAIIEARIDAKRDAALDAERLLELETGLQDTRLLAAFGVAPRGRARGVSVRVSCDGAAYLPGSTGEAAWRALRATGLCDPAEPLPAPDDEPSTLFVLH
jgi:hypothetical protein